MEPYCYQTKQHRLVLVHIGLTAIIGNESPPWQLDCRISSSIKVNYTPHLSFCIHENLLVLFQILLWLVPRYDDPRTVPASEPSTLYYTKNQTTAKTGIKRATSAFLSLRWLSCHATIHDRKGPKSALALHLHLRIPHAPPPRDLHPAQKNCPLLVFVSLVRTSS